MIDIFLIYDENLILILHSFLIIQQFHIIVIPIIL